MRLFLPLSWIMRLDGLSSLCCPFVRYRCGRRHDRRCIFLRIDSTVVPSLFSALSVKWKGSDMIPLCIVEAIPVSIYRIATLDYSIGASSSRTQGRRWGHLYVEQCKYVNDHRRMYAFDPIQPTSCQNATETRKAHRHSLSH